MLTLAGLNKNRRIILLAAVVNFGALLFGYDSGIAGAAIVLPSFQRTFGIEGSAARIANISSNIVSILYGGAFFGGILAATTSFYLGRRASLLIGCIFFLSGGVVQTTSSTLASIYVGRLLAGFGIGAVSQVCPIYVGECASKEHRSRAVGTFQMCLVTGGMLAYWVGYSVSIHISPNSATQWRIPIGVQLLPGGLFTLGLLLVPESPRFLAYQLVRRERATAVAGFPRLSRFPGDIPPVPNATEKLQPDEKDVTTPAGMSELPTTTTTTASDSTLPEPSTVHLYGSILWFAVKRWITRTHTKGDRDATYPAISALAYLRRLPLSSPVLKAEMAQIYAQIDEIEAERAKGEGTWTELLRKPSNRRRLLAAGFVGSWQIWTAQTAILYYAPTIFMSIGFSSRSTSLLASGVFTCLKVTSTIVALTFTVHRLGRVAGMTIGGLLQGLLFFLIGIILATHPVDPKDTTPNPANIAMMALIYVYVLVYSFTMGPLPWVYASEIFPLHLRDAGQLLFVLLTWSNNFAVAKLTPIGFAQIGWRLWLIYGSFNMGGAVICWLICPETKGKSIEEIDIIFGAISEEERAAHVEDVLLSRPPPSS